MVDSYKVKVFTGDGQTFLRPFVLRVPRVKADGGGPITNNTMTGKPTLGEYFQHCAANGSTILYDTRMTLISGGPACTYGAECGMINWIDMRFFISPQPSVGQSIRLVFNNDSYIIMAITELYDDGGSYRIRYSYDFRKSNNVSVFTRTESVTYSKEEVAVLMSSPIMSFPFVLKNADGTITDYKLRRFASGLCNVWRDRTESTEIKSWIGPTGTTAQNVAPVEYNADMQAWYTGIEPFDADDPYSDIPNSLPSGPAEGTGIPASDPVSIPNLPTVSLLDTGFVTLFNPSMADIKNLADYMWNNNAFDLANFKKIFANPMDCILGLNMVPVTVPATGAASVNIGNLITSVSIPRAASQWQELDCGTLDLGLPLGNYMDYAPNSKYSIYLPYIGIQELSTDDVAGKVLTLKYHVDLMSCACIAYLKCGDSVLYQFSGSCGYPIPVTENSWNNLYKAIADLAIGVGGAVATGGMSAGGLMNGAVDLIQGLKPEIHRSGAIGSAAGLMGIQKPFLIIEIPNLCKPEKQYHYIGYPSFVTKKLNDISGFASFEEIILENIPCTEEEAVMIKNLCKGGIHL